MTAATTALRAASTRSGSLSATEDRALHLLTSGVTVDRVAARTHLTRQRVQALLDTLTPTSSAQAIPPAPVRPGGIAGSPSRPEAAAASAPTAPPALAAAALPPVSAVRPARPAPTRSLVATAGPHTLVKQLPVAQLFRDEAYQRPLDERRVRRMQAEFDPSLLGVLEVSARADNRYAVIDGGHRWQTLAALDTDGAATAAWCKVHFGLTVEQEAALFHDIDSSRRALTGWDRWKARRAAEDPLVLDVEAVLAEHGLRTGDKTRQDGVVRAVGACEAIVNRGGVSLLRDTLEVILAAWGRDSEALIRPPLEGVAAVLSAYDRTELNLEHMVRQMQTLTPRQVQARANARREAQSGTLPRLVAGVLVDTYNTGRSSRRLSPFELQVPVAVASAAGATPGSLSVSRSCACGAPIVRRSGLGRWPSRCPACHR